MRVKENVERMAAAAIAGNQLTFPDVPSGEEWEVISAVAFESTVPMVATDVNLIMHAVDANGQSVPVCCGHYTADVTFGFVGARLVNYHPAPGTCILKSGEHLMVRDMQGTQPAQGGGIVVVRRTGT